MSFGPQRWQYPPVSGVAPDSDQIVYCFGCRRLLVQIANQPILITFGRGPQGTIVWDLVPEPYFPVLGPIAPTGGFDAFKYRAQIPAAQLPVGALQAYATLTPRQ